MAANHRRPRAARTTARPRPRLPSRAGGSPAIPRGGGLALATLLRVRDEGLPLPAYAICFSPWTDLAGTGDSLRDNDGRCPVLREANIAEFARVCLGDASPRHPWTSPLYGDLAGLPPVLLQVASDEVLLDDARRVHEKILGAGGRSRLTVFDRLLHVWQMGDGLVPEARTALGQAAVFADEAVAAG